MKIVSWPGTAQTNFSAVLIHFTGSLSTKKYYHSKCLYLWFLHYAFAFWLIFSIIRMPTRNWNCSIKQRSRLSKEHVRQERRTSQIATSNLGILCRPWRLVLHTYIRLLYYGCCYCFMYYRTIWMKIVSQPSTFWVWLWGC